MNREQAENTGAQIQQLCDAIDLAVQGADWTAAGTLLARRQKLLDSVFETDPATAEQAELMANIAQKVMAFDNEVLPVARAARSDTVEQLKKLQKRKRATAAYDSNAS